MKQEQLEIIIEGILTENAELVDLGRSPLEYNGRANSKNRLALIDTTSELAPPQSTYYTDYTTWRKYTGRYGKRRKLKKPVVDEFIKGGPDHMVAFQDWQYWGDQQAIYLNYIHIRNDQRGKGYARKLIQGLIDMHPDLKILHFGKMMREEIGHLKRSFEEKYEGQITVLGAVNY
jgi:hypothetical protein